MMLGADPLGPRFHTITLRDSHPAPLLRERQAHYGIWEQKRQLIEWLVVRVIVTDGEVEIRYAIPTSPAGEGTRFCQLRADYRAALGSAQGVAGHCHPL